MEAFEMAREPGYCRHKATNQAYVRLNGRVIYLGEYGSEKSKERYNRLTAEWLVNSPADSQEELEFLVRELGSMRFANFLVVRVELPGYRGAFC